MPPVGDFQERDPKWEEGLSLCDNWTIEMNMDKFNVSLNR